MLPLHKIYFCFASFLVSFSSLLGHSQERITIFIHGTLPPVISNIVHAIDVPLGVTPSANLRRKIRLNRIGDTINSADPRRAQTETFYLFGWSGNLSLNARREAANELYHFLKNCAHKQVTLVCHSHGGNVALHVAEIAEQHNNTELSIDKLVLTACPVQKATERYISSPIFKRVYSLYSATDFTQIADIQGFSRNRFNGKISRKNGNFFSQRTFAHTDKLIQARILLDKKDPWHIDFIRTAFLSKLHATLDLLDYANKFLKNMKYNGIFSINIPKNDIPYLMLAKQDQEESYLPSFLLKLIEHSGYIWLKNRYSN